MTQDNLPPTITKMFTPKTNTVLETLQQAKDTTTFWQVHSAMDSAAIEHYTKFTTVDIEGQHWRIVTPMDMSIFVAFTEDFGAAKDRIVQRQYEKSGVARANPKTEAKQIMYYVLDGVDIDRQPRTALAETQRTMFYDILFLHTTEFKELVNCHKVVFTRATVLPGSSTSQWYGMLYSSAPLGPKYPEFFTKTISKERHPFIDLDEGWYWYSDPDRAELGSIVVYVNHVNLGDGPVKMVNFNSIFKLPSIPIEEVSHNAIFNFIRHER